MKAVLLLENGKIFKGDSFGASGEATGEVVFNTSMTGYQEVLTDPSYCGQIVNMTYTQIGNYGINEEDVESEKIQVRGFAVREFFDYYSNWRATGSLVSYLKKNNIIGISNIDTRMLTRLIRLQGAMNGIISTETDNIKKLKQKLSLQPAMDGSNLVQFVSCKEKYTFNEHKKDYKYLVVAIDFGIKWNILRCLDSAGFRVIVVPADTPPDIIMNMQPDGLFLSNGPGDPSAVDYAIKNVSALIGKIPIFGICLGHQIIAIALGAKTYKLKFGHHGVNHPVKNLSDGKVEITTQNHGFAVEPDSLEKIKKSSYKITHINLNDNTIEGVEYPDLYIYSVQYHPEVSPGPQDSRYIFDNFHTYIKNFKKKK